MMMQRQGARTNPYQIYVSGLISRFWDYATSQNYHSLGYLDSPPRTDRPPVFVKDHAEKNVVVCQTAAPAIVNAVQLMIPPAPGKQTGGKRHRWYRSMKSSQALAQGVLGNLAVHNLLGNFASLVDDFGDPLFGPAAPTRQNFEMEHDVTHLEEPRPTSLDGLVAGDYRVAIECKFTEAGVGTCSRPGLPSDADEYCNGTYALQGTRLEAKCSLTHIGVKYWEYVPQLFAWNGNCNWDPCPLAKNYQLVRNVLAVGVKDGPVSPGTERTVSLDAGHVVLIYDKRNPAFLSGGKGLCAFCETRAHLRNPRMLRKISWQRIVKHMRDEGLLKWLIAEIDQKYGL